VAGPESPLPVQFRYRLHVVFHKASRSLVLLSPDVRPSSSMPFLHPWDLVVSLCLTSPIFPGLGYSGPAVNPSQAVADISLGHLRLPGGIFRSSSIWMQLPRGGTLLRLPPPGYHSRSWLCIRIRAVIPLDRTHLPHSLHTFSFESLRQFRGLSLRSIGRCNDLSGRLS
jgi:hypothetical protein